MGEPTIEAIVVGDEPDTWRAGGFTVDDDGTCRVGTVRIELVGREAGKRILGWRLRDVPDGTTDVDGLPTEVGHRPPATPAEHANGALLIDHLVVMSPDVGRTVTALGKVGLEPRRTRDVPAEQYGFPAKQIFFRLGEVILELIGAEEPTGDGPAAFFGLAHTVDDLDAAGALLGPHMGTPKEAVQPGRSIATLRHKELGMSVATVLMSPEP